MTKHHIFHHNFDLKLQEQYNKAFKYINTVPRVFVILFEVSNFRLVPKSITFNFESDLFDT